MTARGSRARRVGPVTCWSVCCAHQDTCGGRSRRVLDPTVRDLGSRRWSTPFPRRRDEPPPSSCRVRMRPHPEVRWRCGEASGRLVWPSPRACLACTRSPASASRTILSSKARPPREGRAGEHGPASTTCSFLGLAGPRVTIGMADGNPDAASDADRSDPRRDTPRSLPTDMPHALLRAARRFPRLRSMRRRDGCETVEHLPVVTGFFLPRRRQGETHASCPVTGRWCRRSEERSAPPPPGPVGCAPPRRG